MCYHVSQETKVEQLAVEFSRPVVNDHLYTPAYHVNAFNDPFQPVLSSWSPGLIDMYKWRLIPTDKDLAYKPNTRNAQSEKLFETRSYRDYWENRFLLICTGFFEPHFVDPKKPTESFYIKPKTGGYIMLGGIFSPWKDIKTFTVITTEASPLMAEIHNEGKRMPLVLSGKQASRWLSPHLSKDEMISLMQPYTRDDTWATYRVIDGITNSRKDTNVPEVLKPYVPAPARYDDLPLFGSS